MARSPIEMMVDRACGFDPDAPRPPKPPIDLEASTLMRVGTAAVAWHAAREAGLMTHAIAHELDSAAAALAGLGW